jgi:pyruvate ferredoxin oxidoreductase alpha subunit
MRPPMLQQIEGSHAVAEAVAMSRPEVICTYPIAPQDHIVDALSAMVQKGELDAKFFDAESEFAAMSAAIGAAAAGARTYTATAAQSLLSMSEAVHHASWRGLPIVMTVANRAIGGPASIWSDHSDAMSQRDSGWIQLYAESSQEALDLHIQAFRIAEELSLPVMVCVDGSLLTHSSERVDVPGPDQVDLFLPPYAPRQAPDPADPVSIGSMGGSVGGSMGDPEAFTQMRYLAYQRMREALEVIPAVAGSFRASCGRRSGGLVRRTGGLMRRTGGLVRPSGGLVRPSGGLVRPYRVDDAEVVVVALGSVLGTVKDTVDELREEGLRAGALGITTYRPFPAQAVREALTGPPPQRLVVIERALSPGGSGAVTADIRMALAGETAGYVRTVVAGLGGRAITNRSLHAMLWRAAGGSLPSLSFLDRDTGLVERELDRMRAADGSHRGRGAGGTVLPASARSRGMVTSSPEA